MRPTPSGNLQFRKTARNFNPNVAMAGRITVVEVEKIVETGTFDPDQVHLAGIFVHRIVLNATPREAHRTTHGPGEGRLKEQATWHGPAMKWPPAQRKNSPTATT